MIMRRLGRRTGQHRDATATPLESRRTGRVGVPLVRQSGRAAGGADGVPAGAAKAALVHTKKGAPTSYDVGAPFFVCTRHALAAPAGTPSASPPGCRPPHQRHARSASAAAF